MRYLLRLFVVMMLLLTVAACSSEETPLPDPPTRVPSAVPPTETPTLAPATDTPIPSATPLPLPVTRAENFADQSYLRIVHAIPGSPEIDVYIDGLALTFNLDYGRSSGEAEVVGGEYTLRVMPNGAIPGGEIPPLLEMPLALPVAQTSTLVVSGTLDAVVANLYADFVTPLESDSSRLNLIHAIPDGPAVTIRQNGAAITTPVTFTQQSVPVSLLSGPSTVSVFTGETPMIDYAITLQERRSYTLILISDPLDFNQVQVVEITNRVPGLTTLRGINMSPELLSADIYLNGTLYAGSLEYTRTTERQTIPSETYTVEVYPAGTPYGTVAPLQSVTLNAREDQDFSLILSGTLEQLDIVRYRDDLSPVPPGQSRIVFSHMLSDTDRVRVYIEGEEAPGVGQLAYRDTSDEVLLDAIPRRFEWQFEDGNTAEEQLDVQLEPGLYYIYFLTGRGIDEPPIILSEAITTDERLSPELLDVEPTLVPEVPATIRVVNLLEDRQPVDVRLDGNALVQSLAHTQVSEGVPVAGGIHNISVRFPGIENTTIVEGEVEPVDPNDLVSVGFDFRSETVYTVYVYGFTINDPSLLILDNPIVSFEDDTTSIRLVNLTLNADVGFGLAIAENSLNATQPEVNPTAQADIPNFRSPLFSPSQTLVVDIGSGAGSLPFTVLPGIYDLFLIDTDRSLLAKAEFDQPLESGLAYDLVAIQLPTSIQVNTFLISYPQP